MMTIPQGELPQGPFRWTRGLAARETLQYLDRNGIETEPLLSKAQLSRRQVLQEAGGVSFAAQHRFLEIAASEANNSLLGLHVAAEMNL